MMRRVLVIGILMVFVICSAVLAQTKSVKLEYKFVKGAVDKYQMAMNMKMTLPGMPGGEEGAFTMKMTGQVTQKVLDVFEDGSAKVQMKVSNLKMTGPGMTEQAPPGVEDDVTVTMTMTKTGKVTNTEGLSSLTGGIGMPGMDFSQMMNPMSMQNVAFPDKEISIGEMWSANVPIPVGGSSMNVDSTLLNVALPLGQEVVSKIKQTFKGHIDMSQLMQSIAGSMPSDGQSGADLSQVSGGMDISGWSNIYFSPEKGKMIKNEAVVTIDTVFSVPGGPSDMRMHADMNVNVTHIK